MPSSTKLSSLLRTFLSKSRASLLMLSPSSSSAAAVSNKEKPLGSFIERYRRLEFEASERCKYRKLLQTYKKGAEAAVRLIKYAGHKTQIKDYQDLIAVCVERAKASDDPDSVLQEVNDAYELLRSMKKQVLEVGEATYGPVLRYLIEAEMKEEFYAVEQLVKAPYYEMLLHIRTNDGGAIRRLCAEAISSDEEQKHDVIGHYLVALCAYDSSREEIPNLLDVIDVKRISSRSLKVNIFNSLGRLQRESTAEKFLWAIHDCGEIENASELIFSYAANLPNLAIEEVILKYENLHEKLKLNPSSTSSGKLIAHCCNLHEVCTAFDLAEKLADSGLTLAPEVLTDIVHATEDTMHTIKMPCELRTVDLTDRVTALIRHRNSRPDAETFRCLIHLAIGTGDFRVADKVLEDMEELNVKPTTSIYNTIIAGYVDGIHGESEVFEDKMLVDEMLEDEMLEDIDEYVEPGSQTSYKEMANAKAKEKVKLVLGQMKAANLEPDSQTFSYLISISDSEEDIVKYREEMKRGGLQLTTDVYTSLINAYASLGQLEKAKKIRMELLDAIDARQREAEKEEEKKMKGERNDKMVPVWWDLVI